MSRSMLALVCLAAVSLLPACASRPGSSTAWCNPKDGMTFVWIPAGSFTAQVLAEKKAVDDPEKTVPQEVTFVQGFWLGCTEVTVGQFDRFVKETGYVTDAEKAKNRFTWKSPGFPQQLNHPVVYLSYRDARSYAQWAGVDLPNEAEWLYACRAGTTTKFYWGDTVDDRYLWHRCNTDGAGTRPVARKLPNAWGLYDMVGNAWEYCKTCDSDACSVSGRLVDPLPAISHPHGNYDGCSPGGGRGAALGEVRPQSEVSRRTPGTTTGASAAFDARMRRQSDRVTSGTRQMDFGVTDKKQAELEARMAALGLRKADLEEKFIHSSGPGGQRVNKTASCVYLKHVPTGLEVKMQQERQQRLNRY